MDDIEKTVKTKQTNKERKKKRMRARNSPPTWSHDGREEVASPQDVSYPEEKNGHTRSH